jgi:hypothetical protein
MLLVELWHLVVLKDSIEFRFTGPIDIHETYLATIAEWIKPPNKTHASTSPQSEPSLPGSGQG